MAEDKRVELLGLGISTVDELLVVAYHPRPNDKQPVLARIRQCGGLTGSALVAASRQGVSCGYAIQLGTGELSSFTRDRLTAEGIRLFDEGSDPAAEPFLSIIINEQGTGERCILWDNAHAKPPLIDERTRRLALSAKCLFVDHVWSETILDLVREARAAEVDVVGDYERSFAASLDLMRETNHIILPIGYARELFGGDATCAGVASQLAADPGRAFACVTDGVNGCWFALGDKPDAVLHQPAFVMEKVVDTTGCGDVFHGVYAASLIQGYSAPERVRRAAAASALKTQKAGAQAGAPTSGELAAFLEKK